MVYNAGSPQGKSIFLSAYIKIVKILNNSLYLQVLEKYEQIKSKKAVDGERECTVVEQGSYRQQTPLEPQ